ncbi:MAG: alanine racemase [Candidatus Vogelbacteria bacterium]|nr:alanine racemase [Candidatus Vogelbacteria bacterium]
MKKIRDGHLRTWIEVERKAVAHNYRVFRRLVGLKVKLMAVVKSNGYGHGLVPFAKLLSRLGADWLGVDSMVEAERLREEGLIIPILVLGYTRPENFARAAFDQISLTISTPESLSAVGKFVRREPILGRQLRLQLKVDTGMHRQGFLLAEFQKLQPVFKSRSWQGIYSHLAASEGKARPATKAQIREFENFLSRAPSRQLLKHLAATGGALAYPEARFDLVRIGLGLYGLWPNQSLRRRFGSKIKLHPALQWKTVISEVKILPAGGRVGYDLTESVRPGTKLAVCPVGYWHGYPRALSGLGRVRIKNQWAKVIGRVSMDMITVDVSRVNNARVGDEVVLIGKGCPAEQLAQLAHTSNYEIVTRLNPLIERFYI